jgi:hypothetical protein
MHWYYFKMCTKNLEKGTQVKINIRNLHRSRSLYECGMLPKFLQEGNNSRKWRTDAYVTHSVSFFQTDQNDPYFDPTEKTATVMN